MNIDSVITTVRDLPEQRRTAGQTYLLDIYDETNRVLSQPALMNMIEELIESSLTTFKSNVRLVSGEDTLKLLQKVHRLSARIYASKKMYNNTKSSLPEHDCLMLSRAIGLVSQLEELKKVLNWCEDYSNPGRQFLTKLGLLENPKKSKKRDPFWDVYNAWYDNKHLRDLQYEWKDKWELAGRAMKVLKGLAGYEAWVEHHGLCIVRDINTLYYYAV